MTLVAEIIDKVSEEGLSHRSEVSKVIQAKINHILDAVMSDYTEIKGAIVSGSDGLAWAERLQEGFDQARFAAMSSALLGLSDNVVKEAHSGSVKNVLIQSDDGNIFVLHAGDNLLLTVFCKASANLGLSLAHASKAAGDIGYLL